MEISASAKSAPTPSVREAQPMSKLATLRALQKALDAERQVVEQTSVQQEGKGQLLDIHC